MRSFPKKDFFRQSGRIHSSATTFLSGPFLNYAMYGDDAHDPQIIETVPKKGYRLVVDVKPANGHDPANVTSSQLSFVQVRRKVMFFTVKSFVHQMKIQDL